MILNKVWIPIFIALVSTHAWAEETKGRESKKPKAGALQATSKVKAHKIASTEAAPIKIERPISEETKKYLKANHPGMVLEIPAIPPLKFGEKNIRLGIVFVQMNAKGGFSNSSLNYFGSLDSQAHCVLTAAQLLEQSIRRAETQKFIQDHKLSGVIIRFRDFSLIADSTKPEIQKAISDAQKYGSVTIESDGVLYVMVDYDPSRPQRSQKNLEHCYAPEINDLLEAYALIDRIVTGGQALSKAIKDTSSLTGATVKSLNDDAVAKAKAEEAAAAALSGQPKS